MKWHCANGEYTASEATLTDRPAAHDSDLERLMRILRRRVWVIVACVAVVGASALVFSLQEPKEYSAKAWLLFRDPAVDRDLFQNTSGQNSDAQRQAATNLKLVSLPEVANRAAGVLGGGLTGREIQSRVAVSGEGNADVVAVTATDSDPPMAAKLANVFAQQFIAIRREADQAVIRRAQAVVQQRLDDLATTTNRRALQARADDLKILAALQTGKAELAQAATVPSSASSPRPLRNTVLGLFLGLILGIGLALLIDRLDRRFKDPRELAEAYGLPVLGTIPETQSATLSIPVAAYQNGDRDREEAERSHRAPVEGHEETTAVWGVLARVARPKGNGSGAVGANVLRGAFWEGFRKLRARLRYFNVDRDVVTVLVTSSASGEGKTTIASNLAIAAAVAGQTRVLLLEADLRQPRLSSRFDLVPMPGLAELLTHDMKIREATQRVALGVDAGLDVMVGGATPPNPSELLESRRMSQLLAQLRTLYDLIIIDTPPLLLVADAMPLMRTVDGVIAVARLGMSTRDDAQHLRHELGALRAPTLGIVVNGVKAPADAYYAYSSSGHETESPMLERVR